MTRGRIARFLATLLVVSWAGQALVLFLIGGVDAPGAAPFFVALMLLPGLFGLAVTYAWPEVRREIRWKPANATPLLLSVLVPLAIAFALVATVTVLGLGKSDYFTAGAGGVDVASGPWLLGTGLQGWPVFVANVLITALVFACVTSLATLGEEYGWRGVLQGPMIREFGFGPGVALLGFVWAIWHAPIVLAGYNYPETPVLGAFVFMPLLFVPISFVMAWLTLWNRSFWPAVLMHGAINSVYDGLITKISLERPNAYTIALTEIALFVVAAAVAARLARRHVPAGPPLE